MQLTLPSQFGEIEQRHAELVLYLFLLFFCCFLLFCLCLYFFLHLVKHKEKTFNKKRVRKLLGCFYSPRPSWRKKPEVKFHIPSNTPESAHESVNGPLRWPNAVFTRSLAYAIHRTYKDCKNQTRHWHSDHFICSVPMLSVLFFFIIVQCIDGFGVLLQRYTRKGNDAKNPAMFGFFFVTQLNTAHT